MLIVSETNGEHRSLLVEITVEILLMASITRCSHCEPNKFILSIMLYTHTRTRTQKIVHSLIIRTVGPCFFWGEWSYYCLCYVIF
jgi:hypothetical protein